MFRKTYPLPFRLLGIPVQLDITFLIILPLLAWLIGSGIPEFVSAMGMPVAAERLEQGWLPYLLGLIAAVGLFISVVIHELGHSVVARRYGVEVKSITLWFLGGMAQFDEMPRQRGAEAVVAIAGPLTSFALGFLLWLPLLVLPGDAAVMRFIFMYLWYTNWVLAIFNLLPALPLDGGRVMRSLLALKLPYLRATEISGSISRVMAVLLGLAGLLLFHNIFLVLIAFFIYIAVNAETQQLLVSDMLRGIGVRDLMTREVKTVPPRMTVGELTGKMLQDHHRGFPVTNGELCGMVTIQDVQGADPETPVEQIMSRELKTVHEEDSALTAFQRMSEADAGRLVVVDQGGQMVGILTRTDLLRAVQVRALGLNPPQRRPVVV